MIPKEPSYVTFANYESLLKAYQLLESEFMGKTKETQDELKPNSIKAEENNN